jgi:hypothetical protein
MRGSRQEGARPALIVHSLEVEFLKVKWDPAEGAVTCVAFGTLSLPRQPVEAAPSELQQLLWDPSSHVLVTVLNREVPPSEGGGPGGQCATIGMDLQSMNHGVNVHRFGFGQHKRQRHHSPSMQPSHVH